jgi:hypothetical protein
MKLVSCYQQKIVKRTCLHKGAAWFTPPQLKENLPVSQHKSSLRNTYPTPLSSTKNQLHPPLISGLLFSFGSTSPYFGVMAPQNCCLHSAGGKWLVYQLGSILPLQNSRPEPTYRPTSPYCGVMAHQICRSLLPLLLALLSPPKIQLCVKYCWFMGLFLIPFQDPCCNRQNHSEFWGALTNFPFRKTMILLQTFWTSYKLFPSVLNFLIYVYRWCDGPTGYCVCVLRFIFCLSAQFSVTQ